MLSLILALFAIASPVPPPAPSVLQQWERNDIKLVAESAGMTLLVLDTQDTVLVPTGMLQLSDDGFYLQLVTDDSVLSSSYADAQHINHTVTTDCRRYSNTQACVDAHAAALAKMRVVFPAA